MNPSLPEELAIPESLSRMQKEFGQSIATAFKFNDDNEDYELQIDNYSMHILELMKARGNLSGAERLSTYNQQYWFRLFTVMQDEFPLLRHLLGVSKLNQLTSEYLTIFPSVSPTLNALSDYLIQFMEESDVWYQTVYMNCATLERIFIKAFDAPSHPSLRLESLNLEEQNKVLSSKLNFQPHCFFFEGFWNLMELRPKAKQDSEDKLKLHPKKQHEYWAIYRNADGINTQNLGPLQFQLLTLLFEGSPLDEACDELMSKIDENDLKFLTDNIQQWFSHWMHLGWFY